MKRFETAQGVAPIEFALGDEVFRAVGEMAGGVILDFAALTTGDPDAALTPEQQAAQGARTMTAVTEFMRASIVPEDWDRYLAAVHDTTPGKVIGLPLLMEIATWLAGEYAAIPTGGQSASTSPPKRSGRVSTGGHSPEVLTYSRVKTPAVL